jgi:hypothetical protein
MAAILPLRTNNGTGKTKLQARNAKIPAVLSYLGWQFCQLPSPNEEIIIMKMPSAISTWFMVLFFLVYGLAAFFPAVFAGMPWLMGILALGAAVFLFIGK